MSFRKYGGTQFASSHNVVKSNVNTTNSFYVTENVGQPNTYINFESDISGNIIIYGDLDVSGNLNVTGDVDINGKLHVQENIDCSGNANIDGDLKTNTIIGRTIGSGVSIYNEAGRTGDISFGNGTNRSCQIRIGSGSGSGSTGGVQILSNSASGAVLTLGNPSSTTDMFGFTAINTSTTNETRIGNTSNALTLNGNTMNVNTVSGTTNIGNASGTTNFTGNVTINNPAVNPSYALNINGSVNATSYNSSSDYRIKKDVVTLDETFTVDKLRPITYNNINLGKQDIGLIAHELQEIYPFLVNGEKDGEHIQSVNYTGLIGILIKEVQELKERVKKLEEN